MNEFDNLQQRGLDESLDVVGEIVLYKGASVRAIVNSVELSSQLEAGGLQETLATFVIIPRCALSTVPIAGETLIVDGQTARIEKVDRDKSSYQLTCVTAQK